MRELPIISKFGKGRYFPTISPRSARFIAAVSTAALCTCAVYPATAAEDKGNPPPAFQIPEETQILLENHCLDCHDDIEQKGDIRLDNLAELDTSKRLDLLNLMQEQVYFQHMPPKKKSNPARTTGGQSLP